jgi:hypothetical protein
MIDCVVGCGWGDQRVCQSAEQRQPNHRRKRRRWRRVRSQRSSTALPSAAATQLPATSLSAVLRLCLCLVFFLRCRHHFFFLFQLFGCRFQRCTAYARSEWWRGRGWEQWPSTAQPLLFRQSPALEQRSIHLCLCVFGCHSASHRLRRRCVASHPIPFGRTAPARLCCAALFPVACACACACARLCLWFCFRLQH